jgi:NAD kinase
MGRLSERKIVLVVRETRLDDLVKRYNTLSQARFYIEHLGADFSDYVTEDKIYKTAIKSAEATLSGFGRLQVLDRRFVPNFMFGDDDVIVVLGQDGLVANTLKYLDRQPVVGVNPDPGRWDGVLLPFEAGDLEKIIPEVLSGQRRISDITMAKAELSDGQRLYGVNDLFIGARTHVSARYSVEVGGRMEVHSSSGIIVSTGLGSTGWLKSILAGAAGIAHEASGQNIHLSISDSIKWDARYLYYSVREPFPSRRTSASIVFGRITENSPMTLVSQMPGNGVIFSDGIEHDFLEFNSGMTARVTPA